MYIFAHTHRCAISPLQQLGQPLCLPLDPTQSHQLLAPVHTSPAAASPSDTLTCVHGSRLSPRQPANSRGPSSSHLRAAADSGVWPARAAAAAGGSAIAGAWRERGRARGGSGADRGAGSRSCCRPAAGSADRLGGAALRKLRPGGPGGAAAGSPTPAEGSRGASRLWLACAGGRARRGSAQDMLPAAVCLSGSGGPDGQAGQGAAGAGLWSRRGVHVCERRELRGVRWRGHCGRTGSAGGVSIPALPAAGEDAVTGSLRSGPFLRVCVR